MFEFFNRALKLDAKPVTDADSGLGPDGKTKKIEPSRLRVFPADKDIPADSIHGTYEQSQAVLDDLAALGIGYDDVVQTLEDQGVTAFDASWDHLGQRLATALGTPGR